jgi:hypothetical protein
MSNTFFSLSLTVFETNKKDTVNTQEHVQQPWPP